MEEPAEHLLFWCLRLLLQTNQFQKNYEDNKSGNRALVYPLFQEDMETLK